MKFLKTLISVLIKAITIFFLILGIAILIISLVRPEWMKAAIEWIGDLIHLLGPWNYLIAFVSSCLESFPIVGTMVPGMNVMILVGGFWGGEHAILTIALAIIGAMLGNYIGYWIGRFYGESIIRQYGDYIGLWKTEQKIIQKQLEKNGFWYIVLGKFHNFTRAFVPFIAGAGGMREKNFWVYNIIGSILWATSIILLGIFFIGQYEVILDNLGKILTAILVLVALYFFFFKKDSVKQYWYDKNAEIEERYGTPPSK